MSLAAFQSALTQLVANAAFRDDLCARGDAALVDYALTPKERMRVTRLAADRGVKVTATLVESFRLGKILKLVPLTRTLLGDARIGTEARAFWIVNSPRSFYAIDEVIAFCDFLDRRIDDGLDVPYLRDVVSLERAMLDLRRPRAEAHVQSRLVRFHHDPIALLGPLAAGHVPHDVPPRRCSLITTVEADGTTHWELSSQIEE